MIQGDLIAILASSVWGLYPVLAKRMLRKYSALKTMTYSSLFGTIFFLVIGLNRVLVLPWSEISYSAWGSLLYSIALVTAFGLVVWYHAISKIGANRVMAHMYAVPAVAVITAAVLLKEQVHLMQGVGAVIIYVGICMIRKDKFTVLQIKDISVDAK